MSTNHSPSDPPPVPSPAKPSAFRSEQERRAFRRWVEAHKARCGSEDAARRARDLEMAEWNNYLHAVEMAQKPSLSDRFADALREWWHGR